jgi:hypothetical protein
MGLNIDFAFDVGDRETHHVAFHWGQSFGRVRITVDAVEVLEKNRAINVRSTATRKFEFPVGETEVHRVLIEKISPRLLGGARRQKCRAFVDGELVGEYGPAGRLDTR